MPLDPKVRSALARLASDPRYGRLDTSEKLEVLRQAWPEIGSMVLPNEQESFAENLNPRVPTSTLDKLGTTGPEVKFNPSSASGDEGPFGDYGIPNSLKGGGIGAFVGNIPHGMADFLQSMGNSVLPKVINPNSTGGGVGDRLNQLQAAGEHYARSHQSSADTAEALGVPFMGLANKEYTTGERGESTAGLNGQVTGNVLAGMLLNKLSTPGVAASPSPLRAGIAGGIKGGLSHLPIVGPVVRGAIRGAAKGYASALPLEVQLPDLPGEYVSGTGTDFPMQPANGPITAPPASSGSPPTNPFPQDTITATHPVPDVWAGLVEKGASEPKSKAGIRPKPYRPKTVQYEDRGGTPVGGRVGMADAAPSFDPPGQIPAAASGKAGFWPPWLSRAEESLPTSIPDIKNLIEAADKAVKGRNARNMKSMAESAESQNRTAAINKEMLTPKKKK